MLPWNTEALSHIVLAYHFELLIHFLTQNVKLFFLLKVSSENTLYIFCYLLIFTLHFFIDAEPTQYWIFPYRQISINKEKIRRRKMNKFKIGGCVTWGFLRYLEVEFYVKYACWGNCFNIVLYNFKNWM